MTAHSERGFSLVELMVALVVSGILVGVVFQFLLGQGQVARYQTAREEVQQNARVALDLISSDLRAVGPQGIVAATSEKLVFRTPRAWGLVCGPYGTTDVAVIFPAAAVPVFRTASSASLADLLAIGADGVYAFYAVTDITQSGSNTTIARDECTATVRPNPALPTSPTPEQSQARLFRFAVTRPSGLVPRRDVYVYDQIEYDVAQSNVAGQAAGLWIRRKLNEGSAQPVAGPLPPQGGLVFAYQGQRGNNITNPAGTENSIARVLVTVRTNSRATFKNQAQDDTDSTRIYLRNR